MKTLVQWNPIKELDEFQNRLGSFFNKQDSEWLGAAWSPLVDVIEEDKEYLIKAEIPEVDRDHVKVTVNNGTLTISGERKLEKEDQTKKYHRVERSYGSFVRSFTLPDQVEARKVTADFKNGLLTVRLPKAEKALPREVEVKIS
ncbi:MAG: Hsp20/alpha crystallin family protein [Verrucomicrobiales bacterium]|jgi:HSP20 family protein|nr:Hsp20/alpha crystallin family protein [Verrucomicrobiales bacterium]